MMIAISCNEKFQAPIPVILGSYVNAIGLIRSFAAKKVPTICIDHKKNLAGYSKFTKFEFCPSPVNDTEKFINYLVNLGKALPFKGVLFATNDEWLIPISKRRSILKKYFLFPMSDWPVIEKAMDKQKMYKIANEAKIPISETFFLSDIHEMNSAKNCIAFPFILKPSITVNFSEKLESSSRTIFISNEKDLNYWYNKIIEKELDKIPLIIQEYIPGSFRDLYTITSYANKKGEITAYSIGYKIRQYPSVAGTITCGFVKDEPIVYKLASNLIRELKFYGISNIEFKFDYRDKIFKLIEINPRPGKWNYSVYTSGVNLPYIAYMEALGRECSHKVKGCENILWIHLKGDITCLFRGHNGKLNKQTIPFLAQMVRILWGAKTVLAVESLRDPVPMLYEWGSLVYKIFRR